ncbi:YlqD family protein [Gracilibacillus phocaeensis]|uniref:YlqD family protein n=1 Tax=Gracilibacillus phocaeensis TaxID=2042304 RepID=UPI001030DD62|nr:YlqD family protein [Gracilibacillus phocaeensis]
MKIIKKIAVRKVVTDQSKEQLEEEYQFKIFKLEQECDQLKFEQKKLEQQSTGNKDEIAAKFKKRIDSRKDHIKWYQYKLEQLDSLPLDSEVEDGEIEALIDIEEGMSWHELNEQKSITVKDGIIIKIT